MKTSEDFFSLDPLTLPEEVMRHANDARAASQRLAAAKAEVARAEAFKDVVEAELDGMLRKDPEKYGITRVSEGAIGKKVKTHPKHRKAVERIIEAEYAAALCAADVTAYNHRKSNLGDAVQFLLAGFYADPKLGESRRTLGAQKADAAFGRRKDRTT